MRAIALVLALALTSLLLSCGGKAALTDSGAPQGPEGIEAPANGLPDVGELAKHISLLSDADKARVRGGGQDWPYLPPQNWEEGGIPNDAEWGYGSDGVFKPQAANQGDLGNMAYAAFNFQKQQDFAGPNKLTLQWKIAPDPDNVYIALADFGAAHWLWYKPGADNSADLPADLSSCFAPDGETLVAVVLVGGDQTSTLDALILGDPLEPEMHFYNDLSPILADNTAPQTVTFHAYAYLGGATADEFMYDLDGQPGYEQTLPPGQDPQHIYTQPGVYTTQVRVTDSNGNTSAEVLKFTITDPNNTPPVADLSATPNNGAAPLTVQLDGSNSSDNGTIIDYEWDIDDDGDYDYDTGSVDTFTRVFATQGLQVVRLRVTDNDYATDEATVVLSLSSGWKFATVDSGVQTYTNISMTTTGSGGNERACVAYRDDVSGELRFARADALDGSAWGSPYTVDGGSGFEAGYGASMITLPGGNPAIASGGAIENTDGYILRYRCALDPVGLLWSANLTLTDPLLKAGYENSMCIIDGLPAIATVARHNYQVESYIMYLRAEDTLGLTWSSPHTAAPNPGSMVYAPAMTEGDLGPIIAFATGKDSNYISRFHTKRATSVDGSDWTNEYMWGDMEVENTCFIHTDNGFPMAVVGGSGLSPMLWNLRGDSDGMNWESFMRDLTPDAPLHGGHAAAVNLNGTPAIAFQDYPRRELFFMRALNANGTQWPEPQAVKTYGTAGAECSMVSVQGNPVICYYDSDNQKIVAAYYDATP